MEGSPYVNIESSFIPEKSEGNFQNPALNTLNVLKKAKRTIWHLKCISFCLVSLIVILLALVSGFLYFWFSPEQQTECDTPNYLKGDGRLACGIFLHGAYNFLQAEKACKILGGRLPEIMGQEEMESVLTARDSMNWSLPMAIGQMIYNRWSTSHTRVSFHNLYDESFRSGCFNIPTDSDKWHPVNCSTSVNVMCEKLLNFPAGECATVDGPKNDLPCVFPFVYEGEIFNKCISKGFDFSWCSTKTDNDGEHVKGNWGLCNQKCPMDVSEYSWHLTTGGFTASGSVTNLVELFNWQTGKKCFLEQTPKSLGSHSGILMNGDPVVCGGWMDRVSVKECFKYQKDIKNWTRISDLMVGTMKSTSLYRKEHGWFLFGGNDLTISQKLVNVDSKWEAGPNVQTKGNTFQCAVELNDTVTAFIGGEKSPKDIYLYDWSNPKPTFVIQTEKLLKDHMEGSCVKMVDKDENVLVALIGGKKKGMQVWNTKTQSVSWLWDVIPLEKNFTVKGLDLAQIVPVKGGKEFILYGGFGEPMFQKDIWKYVLADNTWTKIGELQVPRASHVTFPVSGIECP